MALITWVEITVNKTNNVCKIDALLHGFNRDIINSDLLSGVFSKGMLWLYNIFSIFKGHKDSET